MICLGASASDWAWDMSEDDKTLPPSPPNNQTRPHHGPFRIARAWPQREMSPGSPLYGCVSSSAQNWNYLRDFQVFRLCLPQATPEISLESPVCVSDGHPLIRCNGWSDFFTAGRAAREDVLGMEKTYSGPDTYGFWKEVNRLALRPPGRNQSRDMELFRRYKDAMIRSL